MAAAGLTAPFTVLEGEAFIWREGHCEVSHLNFKGIGPCIAVIIRGYSEGKVALAAGVHFDSDPLLPEALEKVLAKFNKAREEGKIDRVNAVLVGGFSADETALETYARDDDQFRIFLHKAEVPKKFMELNNSSRKNMLKDYSPSVLYTLIENILRERSIEFTVEQRKPLLLGLGTIVNFSYAIEDDRIDYFEIPRRSLDVSEERRQINNNRMTTNNARDACPYYLYDNQDANPEIVKAPGCWDYIKLAFQSICCCTFRAPAWEASPHVN